MRRQIEKENEEFKNMWKEKRKSTFFKYYFQKLISMLVFMGLLYVLNQFVNPKFDYLMSLFIYLAICFIAPLVSWGINEIRFKHL